MGRNSVKAVRSRCSQFAGTLKELQTANWQKTLKAAEQLGIKIEVRYGTVICHPPQPPQELREAIVRNKTALVVALAKRSEKGIELIEPFHPVIKAAHRGELPAITILQGGKERDLAEYVCAIAAGIWYGETLDCPQLPDWLENLRRIQECWQRWQARGGKTESVEYDTL